MIIEITLILIALVFSTFFLYKKYETIDTNFIKSFFVLILSLSIGIILFLVTGISGLPFLIIAAVMARLITK